jgi:hypothetical protein
MRHLLAVWLVALGEGVKKGVGGVAQRRDARGQHGAVDVRAVLEQQRAGLAEALARPRREGERKPAVLVGVLDGRALRRRRRRHAVCQQGQGQGQRDARWPLARTISSARRMRLRSPCAAARSSIVAAAPTSAAAAPLVLWRDMAGAAAPAALSGAGRTRRRARLPRTQQRHHQRAAAALAAATDPKADKRLLVLPAVCRCAVFKF